MYILIDNYFFPGLLPDHRPPLPEGYVPKPKPNPPLNRYDYLRYPNSTK